MVPFIGPTLGPKNPPGASLLMPCSASVDALSASSGVILPKKGILDSRKVFKVDTLFSIQKCGHVIVKVLHIIVMELDWSVRNVQGLVTSEATYPALFWKGL